MHTFSEQLLICLDHLPGNEEALIGFIGIDSSLHFFQFLQPKKMPRQYIINDIDGSIFKIFLKIFLDAFLPTNFGLVVNLKTFKEV